jgi:hypothetical protein
MGVGAIIGGAALAAGAGAQIYGASQAENPQSPAGGYREISRNYLERYLPAYNRVDVAIAGPMTRREGTLQLIGAEKAGRNLASLFPQVGALEEGRVGGEQGLVGKFAPGVIDILNQYDPNSAALLAELSRQAQEELAAGRTLTPDEARQVQQTVRAGQAARGMGVGPTDTFEESLRLALTGREALAQRRGFASSVINQNRAFYGNPWDYVYRGSGAAPYTAAGLLGVGAGTVRHPPMGPVAGNGPGGAPANNAAANAWSALGAGLMGTSGMLIGNYLNRPVASYNPGPAPQQSYYEPPPLYPIG